MAATKIKEKQLLSSPRPPIVVVLGHVDHGKTTLLDSIRKTDVVTAEYGGITQSIGAYQVGLEGTQRDHQPVKKITFIDTPGHEAFGAMRSRGAMVADIAVLVVAANDSVMPQTVESIKIIKEAQIPYVVVINKIDLPEANVEKVIADLTRHEVLLENYGGDVPFVKVSAKKGEGIEELLDLIELLAEVKEIGKNPTSHLEAVVIESRLDKSRGPLVTVVVKNGFLTAGSKIFAAGAEEKVRALINYLGESISEAGPGTPVEILGFRQVPAVGTQIVEASTQTKEQSGNLQIDSKQNIVLNRSDQEGSQSLALILKADTVGSLEAISAQIPANVNLVSSAVGDVTEKDVMLARSTRAIILGFNVIVTPSALKLTETEKILTRTYKIIYELLDELKDAAEGMLVPEEMEEVLGTGQIVAEFPYEKMRVAGVRVTDRRIARGDLIKIIRGSNEEGSPNVIGTSKVKSLRVGKEETNRVEKGKECGILLDPQVDFQTGDAIISYRLS